MLKLIPAVMRTLLLLSVLSAISFSRPVNRTLPTAPPMPDEAIINAAARLWKERESHRFLFVVGAIHSGLCLLAVAAVVVVVVVVVAVAAAAVVVVWLLLLLLLLLGRCD